MSGAGPQRSADDGGPFTHAAQTVARAGAVQGYRPGATVVLDFDLHEIVRAGDPHPGGGRPGVPNHIGQSFLNDAVATRTKMKTASNDRRGQEWSQLRTRERIEMIIC